MTFSRGFDQGQLWHNEDLGGIWGSIEILGYLGVFPDFQMCLLW